MWSNWSADDFSYSLNRPVCCVLTIGDQVASFIYKDLDMKFRGHPVKHDLLSVIDARAIAESVKMIVCTNFYERPFLNEFGGNVRALLFELAASDTAHIVRDRVREAIEKWEPRAAIEDVSATLEEHTLNVTVRFRVLNKTEVSKVDIKLRLAR